MSNIIENNYVLLLKEKHQYTNLNMSLEEAKNKKPKSIVTMEPGIILYTQKTSFSMEQVAEAMDYGFNYQWGFGPCFEKIPPSKLQFAKVELFNI